MESEQATEELVETNSTWETVQMSDKEQSTDNGELTDEQIAEQLRQAALAAVADQISAVTKLRATGRERESLRAAMADVDARYRADHRAAVATGLLADDLAKRYNCPPPGPAAPAAKKTTPAPKKKPVQKSTRPSPAPAQGDVPYSNGPGDVV